MFKHEPFDLTKCMRCQAAVSRQHDRIEPKFAFAVSGPNMNVWRFTALIGVEMKSESADAKDGRHNGTGTDIKYRCPFW